MSSAPDPAYHPGMMPRSVSATLNPWAVSLLALGVACGDSGGRGDSATAGGTTTATATAGETLPTTSVTGGVSATEATGAGSESMSAGGSTTASSESATGSMTSAATGGSSGSGPGTTGGGAVFCSDDPPGGYVGDFNADCKTEPSIGTFNPVIEWHKDAWNLVSGSPNSASAPIVVQLTDDNGDQKIDEEDMPDILFVSYGGPGIVRAISGDGMTEILSITGAGVDREKCLAAADIDGDGIVEIITSNTTQKIVAYEHDGTLKWTSASLTGHVGNYEVAPAIADYDGAHLREPRQGSSLPPRCRNRSGNWRGLKTRRAAEDSGGTPRVWRNTGEGKTRRAALNRAAWSSRGSSEAASAAALAQPRLHLLEVRLVRRPGGREVLDRCARFLQRLRSRPPVRPQRLAQAEARLAELISRR